MGSTELSSDQEGGNFIYSLRFYSSEWPDRMEWMNTEETGVSSNKFKVTDILL